MNTYPKEIIDCIDKLFPKGDKRRGDALVLQAVAYLEGKEFSKGLICPTSKLKEKIDKEIKNKQTKLSKTLNSKIKLTNHKNKEKLKYLIYT